MPITSSYMGMPVPIVGVDPAPTWASLLVTDLGIIDAHDHSPGNGAPLTSSSLTINATLPMNGNNLSTIKALLFTAQSVPIPATGVYLDALYVSGVDLYYNDGSGNQVRITQSGGIAGSPGSISNLTSPASAAYVALSTKFVWQSAANTSADMDFGAAIMRNNTASSYGLTLQPPTLGSNYSITLPALPGSQKFMTMDASGIMAAPWAVDGSTVEISANTLQVKALGIGTAQLANVSVTPAKLAALGEQTSSSCGSYSTTSAAFTTVTNFSKSITVTGRPVQILVQADGSLSSGAQIAAAFASAGSPQWRIRRAGTELCWNIFPIANVPLSAFSFVDTGATAGTYTYDLQVRNDGSNSVAIHYAVMMVYEIN